MLFSVASMAQELEKLDVSREKDGFFSKTVGNSRIEGWVKNGQKDGVWYEYFTQKEMLHYVVQYQKGKKNGCFIETDENGILRKKMEYANDKLEGTSYVWSAGHLSQKNTYKKGELDGIQVACYDNGNNQEVSNYKNGLRDGVTTWYNHDGVKRMMITYKEGAFEGKQETYYQSGGLKSSKMFKNNVEDGESVEYYESGAMKSTATYKKGVLSGKKKTYDDKKQVLDVKEKGKEKEKVQGKEKELKGVGKKVSPNSNTEKIPAGQPIKKVKKG